MKKCTKCGVSKPANEFSWKVKNKIRKTRCNNCENKKTRKWHRDNKKRVKKYKKEYYIKNKESIKLKRKKDYAEHPEKYRKRLATTKVRFSNLKSRAKRKQITFTLTFEEYSQLLSQPCFYCEGVLPIYGGGLDRYDNTKGYTNKNSVPCCRTCNVLKMDLSILEFFARIETIYKRLKKGLLIKRVKI